MISIEDLFKDLNLPTTADAVEWVEKSILLLKEFKEKEEDPKERDTLESLITGCEQVLTGFLPFQPGPPVLSPELAATLQSVPCKSEPPNNTNARRTAHTSGTSRHGVPNPNTIRTARTTGKIKDGFSVAMKNSGCLAEEDGTKTILPGSVSLKVPKQGKGICLGCIANGEFGDAAMKMWERGGKGEKKDEMPGYADLQDGQKLQVNDAMLKAKEHYESHKSTGT